MKHGFNVVLLGANMPVEQLVVVAQRSGAAAIVLSGSVIPDDKKFYEQLANLVNNCGVPVFVGGHVALIALDPIRRAGAHALGLPLGIHSRHHRRRRGRVTL